MTESQRTALVLASLMALAASPGRAQLSGEHAMLGFGLKSASQAPAGGFLVPTYFDWDVTTSAVATETRFPGSQADTLKQLTENALRP